MGSEWSDERLNALFRTYRDRYWPGRLRGYRVSVRTLDSAHGQCDTASKSIWIDVARHTTDYEVRSTLMHEMAHAAAGPRSRGHDSRFFAELEHLIRSGARLSIDLAENENRPDISSVPDRFPLSKKTLTRAYTRLRRSIAGSPDEQIDASEELINAFENLGADGITWRKALRLAGHQFGLLDVDDRVLASEQAKIPRLRRAYRRGVKLRASFAESRARKMTTPIEGVSKENDE